LIFFYNYGKSARKKTSSTKYLGFGYAYLVTAALENQQAFGERGLDDVA
jgi:hypothetical protein